MSFFFLGGENQIKVKDICLQSFSGCARGGETGGWQPLALVVEVIQEGGDTVEGRLLGVLDFDAELDFSLAGAAEVDD